MGRVTRPMARAADGPADQLTNRSTDQRNSRLMDRLTYKNASNNHKQIYAANEKEAACCEIVKNGHIKDKLSFLFLTSLTNVELFSQ